MSETYVHGYDPRENERLQDQAGTLVDLLHHDTAYLAGSTVLEVGCGVGAQTITLARRSPKARFTSVDISADSIAEARRRAEAAGLGNVEFRQGDIFALPFQDESFDHVFVCFLLEHLAEPGKALVLLRQLLRPGGTITLIEGDHGSTFFHPDSSAAHEAIQCQISLQRKAGGNALIGRQLQPLLVEAGFGAVRVSPRMVYVDSSRPDLVDGFTRKTFTAMIEGIREAAIAGGLIEAERFDAGVRALHRTAEADGVFCYTFFKGVGEKTSGRATLASQHERLNGDSPISARDALAGYIKAYNAKDVASMLTFFGETCVFENISGGKVTIRTQGKTELEALARQSAAAFASREQKVISVTEDQGRLVAEIDYHAVLQADLSPDLKAGSELALRGVSVLEFACGKIVRLSDYS
jgi:SAM-dependent methyltransferase